MAERVRILRIQRTDHAETQLLLRIEQTSSTRPLDLKLTATEHEHVYHGKITGSHVSDLKAARYTGDDDELRDILCSSLLQERPDGASETTLRGLELVAALNDESFVLTIRRRLDEITSRIANIKLQQDDEREELSAFEWVDSAVIISDRLRQQVERIDASMAVQRDEIVSLKNQLEEFVKLKKENDDEILQKFAALLNSKKHKIRELRAMLQRAGVDADADTLAIRSASNKNKRKAQSMQEADGADVDMEEDEDEHGSTGAEDEPSTPQATDYDDPANDEDMPDSSNATMPGAKHTQGKVQASSRSTHNTADDEVDADDAEEEFDDEL